MVHEPVEIEETLVDYVLATKPLVFQDDWGAVFIESQCIDAASMFGSSWKLMGDKPDSEDRLEV